MRYSAAIVTVHLLKLCVGIGSVDQLAESQERRIAEMGRLIHRTRHFPRRAASILDGGSIYWVIKGFVLARQRIVALERVVDQDGAFCFIVRDPKLVRTVAQPRRPHQGWRYFEPADAPRDLAPHELLAEQPPPEMAAELRALGLI